jgi:transposase InsO family protein
MYRALIQLLAFQFAIIQIQFKSKNNLVLETIELRQQLMIYQTKKEDSKNITDLTRSLLVALKKTWPKWMDALIIVKPETVIDWQKRRFKKYWTKKSAKRKKLGRPPIKLEIRQLLKKMATENFIWGAPRIYSELLKLGYTKNQISQRTISRYLKKIRPDDLDKTKGKRQQWKAFLKNHREHIMGMDFFTVPTISFKTLYVFFIIDHARRKIVHFNVTEHPTAQWVVQQLKNAFPFDRAPKYLILDRDSIFSARVKQFIQDMGIKPKVISYKCPWQNGVAERYVLSVRNDMLNQMIIFNDEHLRDLMKQYFKYYNNERCHLAVGRDSPNGRKIQNKPFKSAKIISSPRIGGLHHVYKWDKAA